MADRLRVVAGTPDLVALANHLVDRGAIVPSEAMEEARHMVTFFSALLSLPEPEHAETEENARAA